MLGKTLPVVRHAGPGSVAKRIQQAAKNRHDHGQAPGSTSACRLRPCVRHHGIVYGLQPACRANAHDALSGQERSAPPKMSPARHVTPPFLYVRQRHGRREETTAV